MAKILGRVPSDRWEREVLRQLKEQLPSNCIVVSGVAWSLKTEAGYVKDGQSDFVVLMPGSGMVILEVKGSREFWIDSTGIWYRRGTRGVAERVEEPPPEQAIRNMHDLERIARQKGFWPDFPGRYSYIVAYPNGVARNLPSMFDESTIVTSRQMHELASRVKKALDARGHGSRASQFTVDVAEKIAAIFTSYPFLVQAVDAVLDVQDDKARIADLTRQQFAALRGVFDLPRVGVLGPAGSGKTMLAMWRLQALREAGKSAILVCYNKDLAKSLRRESPGEKDCIFHVDSLFRRMCSLEPQEGKLDQFFRTELPSRVFDSAATLSVDDKYDAIIVDEGQDFSEEQLIALFELMRADGHWTFFADWRQDLYRAGSAHAIGTEVVFTLHHNCRNTVRVNGATNSYLGLGIESMPGMPDGVNPQIELCANSEAMAKRAWELAAQWRGEKSIVILSPYKLDNSCMSEFRKGYQLELTDNVDLLGRSNTVYFSTIKSFKGLEASVVILVDADTPKKESAFTEEDLYVACTRATGRLMVLTKKKEFVEFLSGS